MMPPSYPIYALMGRSYCKYWQHLSSMIQGETIDPSVWCGISSDTPLPVVGRELEKLSVSYVIFNQREFASTRLSFELSNGLIRGVIQLTDRIYHLENVRGIYIRLMDD